MLDHLENRIVRSSSDDGAIERLLKARDVADILGVSANTVLDWAESGRLPSFKLGALTGNGPRRFRRSEIAAWIEEHRAPAAEAAA